jgi:hypothetical protein
MTVHCIQFTASSKTVLSRGKRFARVIGSSTLTILLFAVVYLFGGFVRPVAPNGRIGAAVSIS